MRESRSMYPWRQIGLVLAMPILACDAAPGDGAPEQQDAPAAETGTGVAGGAATSGVDTIPVEGMPEPIRYQVWSTPAGFPLPFKTRLPERLQPVRESEAQLRFDFDGLEDDSAYLRIVVLPAGTDERFARDIVLGLATEIRALGSKGIEFDEGEVPEACSWSEVAYPLRGQVHGKAINGTVCLGQHDDRFFYVMEAYPARYGEGVPVRFHYLLRNWTWQDTGAPLFDAGSAGPLL